MPRRRDRKSTRLNSSHTVISYAVFCLTPPAPPPTLFPYTTLFRSDRVHVGGRRGHPTAGGGRDRVLRVASGLQVAVLRRPRENVLRHPLAVRDGAFEDGPRDAQAPEPLVHGGPERIHPRPRERERPAHGEKRVHPGQG